jgi:large subunit ribosomal protein L17
MRHRVRGRKLGRTTAHRTALFRNQLTALFTHERIITTVAKAKELRPLAERMVTLAGTGTLPARRKVLTMVPDKDVVRRLFTEIAPRFTERPGGYTRIMRLGRRRGDGAEMAIIEFVDYDLADHEEGGTPSKGKASLMDRAKGIFGGGAKAAADEGDQEVSAGEDTAEETVEAESAESEAGEAAPEAVEAAPEEEPEPVAEAAVEAEEAAPVVDEPPAEEEPVAQAEPVEAEEPEAEATTEPEEEKKDS